ncbi:MAG: helix-turn-helix domain-containing protein [Bacteroidota bacterium]
MLDNTASASPSADPFEVLLAQRLGPHIEAAVQKGIDAALPDAVRKATRKEWMTSEEVQQLTGWSYRVLQNLRDTRRLAFSQNGRSILYETASLEALLAEGYVPAKRKKTR